MLESEVAAMRFKAINNENCMLGEGPVWNARNNLLYWTDIVKGEIWSYSPQTYRISMVLSCSYQTGAFLFTEDQSLVLFTEAGVQAVPNCGGSYRVQDIRMLFAMNMINGERFNDAIADPRGRMIAGTKTKECTNGKLYSFCKGEKPKVLMDNLGISNGMGFSPDLKTFYHTDSAVATIMAYDYNLEIASISKPRKVITLGEGQGVPDGMTVDKNGDLWIACWGGAQILHITSNGEVLESIHLPALKASSVCFGGEALTTLFVTTAASGCVNSADGKDKEGRYLGGRVYMLADGGKGVQDFDAII